MENAHRNPAIAFLLRERNYMLIHDAFAADIDTAADK
jgi:hypothetical protein